jgi:hypothetical protein
MSRNEFKDSLILLLALIISGCGSSGGDSGAVNTAPVADAGRDLKALNDVLVVLDGSASSDAEGDSLTYNWTLVSKPAISAATISNSTGVMPTFTTDVPGTYTASLVVNDGVSNSNTDTVSITAISSISHIRDTGQKNCYNNTTAITCPVSGEDFYGQDAHYSTNPLRFVDNSATVSDSITGMIWQKIDDGSRYNWFQATGTPDATYNPGGATDVCGLLSLGGFTDWRLASRRELVSLLNYLYDASLFTYGLAEPAYFDSTGSDYWSSTESQVSADVAWVVDGGRVTYGYGSKGTTAFYARCVRGPSWGQNTYVDNGDGTITDTMSKLVWQQNDDGVARNWQSALAYCENLMLAGSSEWRLPDIKELDSVVSIIPPDETYYLPAISTTYFPTTQNGDYWSSTTMEGSSNYAWIVDFALGDIDTDGEKSGFKFTRCVR